MEKEKTPQEKPRNQKKEIGKGSSGLRSFTHYSGIGLQMVIVILIFYWAGSKLDERAGTVKPVYTTVLTLLGVFAGLYIILKDFIGKKND